MIPTVRGDVSVAAVARRCLLALGVLALAGCEQEPLRLVLRYPDQAAYERAVSVDVYIGEGVDCVALAQAAPAPRLSFDAHAGAPALGEIATGNTSFAAAVRDLGCARFLEGCVQVDLSAAGDRVVRIHLREVPQVTCAADERCADGRCKPSDASIWVDASAVDVTITDTALADAALADAALIDAGASDVVAPDALAPDAATTDAATPDTAISDGSLPDTSLPDRTPPDSGPPWWDPAWGARQYLRFHNVNSYRDLADFPVMVRLEPGRVDMARFNADGSDLRFVADDEVTLLPHEIERWDPDVEAVIWVRVPLLEAFSNQSHVWLYHDNPGAADAQDPAGVWSNGYVSVLHMGSGDPEPDSTGLGNVGTVNNGVVADGIAASARELSGGGASYVEVLGLNNTSFPQEQGTISVYVKGDLRGQTHSDGIIDGWNDTRNHLFVRCTTDETVQFAAQLGDGSGYDAVHSRWISASRNTTWNSFAIRFDTQAGDFDAYYNGERTSAMTTTSWAPTQQLVKFGPSFAGLIDEARVSSVFRSSAWLSAENRGLIDHFVLFAPRIRPADAPPRFDDRVSGALVHYELDEGTGETAHDSSGVAPALDLTIADPDRVTWIGDGLWVRRATILASAAAATKVTDAVIASGEITIEAWLMPDNTLFGGPARVVTLSEDTGARSFTLGQQVGGLGVREGSYLLRFRTDETGSNGSSHTVLGTSPPETGDGSVRIDRPAHVVFTRGGGVIRGYVDGVELVQQDWTGAVDWDPTLSLALANEFPDNVGDNPDRPWLGALYMVAIYGRALSELEIAQNYAAGY